MCPAPARRGWTRNAHMIYTRPAAPPSSGHSGPRGRSSKMEFKDYYALLGVSPDADEQTIRQTYRKLARQYHPDVNPGNKEAEERFKENSEAYQALHDSERRAKYD